jgi:antirestriction protein ArdC
MSREKARFNLHQTLTDQIVAAIERVSADDFRLPWHRSGMSSIQPKNALTKKAYRGINIVSLWVAAEVHHYPHALWASYRQWQELGAQVRKSERSSLVVFYKEYETEPDPRDENDDGKRRVARHSSVFNVVQVDGFTLPNTRRPYQSWSGTRRPMHFRRDQADIRHSDDRAFYLRSEDFIKCRTSVCSAARSTVRRRKTTIVLAHEATHRPRTGSASIANLASASAIINTRRRNSSSLAPHSSARSWASPRNCVSTTRSISSTGSR